MVRFTLLAAFFLMGFAAIPAVGPTQKDIVYGHAGNTPLLLDAVIPDGTGPFPILIAFHGGGWSSGTREGDISAVFPPLTKAGYLIFTVEYRLAPAFRWPACFDDVRTSIRWVKAHAADYGGDPDRVALIGYSAGAHLVTLAYVEAKPDTTVQAVVALAAPSDLEIDLAIRGGLSPSLQNLLDRPHVLTPQARQQLHDMSPVNHVRPGLPPILLLHGTADKSVLYQSSLNFQAALQKNHDACDLITLTGAPHAIAKWPQFDPTYAQQIVAWLDKTLGAIPATAPAAR